MFKEQRCYEPNWHQAQISEHVNIKSMTVDEWARLAPGDTLKVLDVKSWGKGTPKIGDALTVEATFVTSSMECMVLLAGQQHGRCAGRFAVVHCQADHQKHSTLLSDLLHAVTP